MGPRDTPRLPTNLKLPSVESSVENKSASCHAVPERPQGSQVKKGGGEPASSALSFLTPDSAEARQECGTLRDTGPWTHGLHLSCAKTQQWPAAARTEVTWKKLGFELGPALITRHGDIGSEPGTLPRLNWPPSAG